MKPCRFCNTYHYRWKRCKAQMKAIKDALPKPLRKAGMKVTLEMLPAQMCLDEEDHQAMIETMDSVQRALYEVEVKGNADPYFMSADFIDALDKQGYLIVRKEELGDER